MIKELKNFLKKLLELKMNDLKFILHSLKFRWLNNILSVFLTAFGVSIALFIIQFGNHIENRLKLDGKGIDIVVGSKGSPLQLILSSVYHVDVPTGNVSYESVKKLMKNPQIKTAIPLALGDNWKGFRIVGTTVDYLNHYEAKIIEGRIWNENFEIIAGSSIDVKLFEKIIGSHGLLEGGVSHEDQVYTVVGKLNKTNTVLDRLLLTPLNSVLEIHELENIIINDNENNKIFEKEKKDHLHEHSRKNSHHDHNHETHSDLDIEKEKNSVNKSSAEITALLITTKSPVTNINLPRKINKEKNLQAANPAIEITRLASMLGLGSKSLTFFSVIIILIAILSIFSGLAGNLENRLGDLAILRALGYTKKRVFLIISFEGLSIVLTGIIVGIIIGIISLNILNQIISPFSNDQIYFIFNLNFFLTIISILFAGILASVFPAYRGSKISVADQLSRDV